MRFVAIVLGDRRYAIDADADINFTAPGFTNEVKPLADGTPRQEKTRKLGKLENVPIYIDNERGDESHIQELMNNMGLFSVTAHAADGSVYAGEAQIDGDNQTNTTSSIKEITLVGDITLQG